MFKTVVKEQLVVPAHVDYLADIRDFVAKVGHKHGLSTQAINAFKLSIDEATTNIIKHAYRDWEGSITIRAVIKRNSLTFVLIDQGKYFDPRRVKAPDLQRYVKIGKKGGLGIFIMRRLLDDIDYRKTEEGNELRLVKKRDGARRGKIHVPSLSLSLKARYSAITCSILTVVIVIGYMYFFVNRADQALQEVIAEGRPIATNLPSSLPSLIRNAKDELDASILIDYALAAATDTNQYLVYEAFLVDNSGMISNIGKNYELQFYHFAYPVKRRIVNENISIYEADKSVKRSIESDEVSATDYLSTLRMEVIDFAYPLYSIEPREPLGTLHIWLKKSIADQRTAQRRFADLRIAIIVLLIGYASTLVLIYLVLNPFRKLAQWVRTLGHEEVEDEMDIDSSTEVGEIARAFSDITTKLRQSQKNLAEQERLQKEMQVAQEIQRTLLPTKFPDVEGYTISSFYEAAKEVGGDYFDFVEVDRDTLGIAVADVSGKGVPGSLVMTMIRTALRTEARGLHSASEVLCRVNDFVINDMKKGMFVTLFYVIIDSKKRRINYASAGHNPMILYRGSTKKTYYLNPRGFPLGIALPEKDLFRRNIEADTIKLAADDVLILYTDGITEAMNPKREMYGEGRFLDIIRKHSYLPVDAFVEQIKDELHSFTEGNVQNDDITLVAIKEQTTAEQVELGRAKKVYRLAQEGKSIKEACEKAGLSVYAYNKYKEVFSKGGVEKVEVEESDAAIEAQHLSIEEKTKIFEIIRQHPEYGAKRISEELDTETYGFEKIAESRIYDELVRSRLNTRQLREAFVARRGSHKRMKPPGTPLLTLDGRVIIKKHEVAEHKGRTEGKESKREGKARREERPTPPEFREHGERIVEEDVGKIAEELPAAEPSEIRDISEVSFEKLLSDPIEELLGKRKTDEGDEAAEPYFQSTDKEGRGGERETAPSSGESGKKAHAEEGLEDWEEFFREGDEGGGGEYEAGEVAAEESPRGDVSEGFVDFEFELAAENVEEWASDESIQQPGEAESLEIESEFPIDDEFEESLEFDEPETFWEGAEDHTVAERKSRPKADGEDEDFSFSQFLESIEIDGSEAGNGNGAEDIWQGRGGKHSDIAPAERTTGKGSGGADIKGAGTADDTKLLREKVLIRGLRYYKSQRYEEAIRELRRVVTAYPDFKEAHVILGNAYFRNKMYLEAVEQYEKVKEIDPTDPDAYENMGVIYANRGEFDKAIREWETILQIDPNRKDIHKNIERAHKIMGK